MKKPLVAKPIAKALPKSTKPAPPPTSKLPPDGRRWWTCAETSAVLGLSRDHIFKMHRRGQLPSFKLPGLGIRIDGKVLAATFEKQIAARAATAGTSWPT
jgi:hypothetical protein